MKIKYQFRRTCPTCGSDYVYRSTRSGIVEVLASERAYLRQVLVDWRPLVDGGQVDIDPTAAGATAPEPTTAASRGSCGSATGSVPPRTTIFPCTASRRSGRRRRRRRGP